MFKRICALLAALALVLGVCLPTLPAVGLATAAHAAQLRAEKDWDLGRQLNDSQPLGAESRAFYDALLAMYESDALLHGGDWLVELDDTQVQAYQNGQINLGHALTNARDAFYLDYPDLFYVNFNNFALRLKTEGGKTGVYITPGTRGTGYLLDGITENDVPELLRKYQTELDKLVQAGTDAVQTGTDGSLAEAQVRAVHDELTQMLTYTLDNKVGKDDQKYLRTAYGIVLGKGVCEAYSRAFKAAMDRLNIPCVLVEGVFRHSPKQIEAHMWDLVRVGDKWYGVDVTMDDPDGTILDAYGEPAKDKIAYNDYLLAGEVTMGAQHAASTTLSAASYEFSYPELAQDDCGTVTVHNAGGLTVRLDKTADDTNESGGGSGTFYVSYKGMSYTEAAAKGYYILARFMAVDTDADVGYEHFEHFEGTGEWSVNQDWSYLALDLYQEALGRFPDTGESMLPMPHVQHVQFAVTDVAPGDYMNMAGVTDPNVIYEATHYRGDPALLLAKTEVIDNPGGTYQAPPYIKQAWPSQQSTLLIGHDTYQVKVLLDDTLDEDPDAGLGCTVTCYTYVNGKRQDCTESAREYYTMDGLAFQNNEEDGTSTITFSFQPSEQWAHDTIFYQFDFTGVVGKKSGKKPNSLIYLAGHPCSAYAYQSQGFDWNLYGKPQLMDDFSDEKMDISDWTVKDETTGKEVPLPNDIKALKHRMALVVSDTTPDQTTAMEDQLETKYGITPDEAKIETYSINLTVCKSQIVSTGQAVRVMLGFPEGYGPDDAGVTFKAYHYIVDASGNITGVEPIPCIVTPQGLLVLCSSFSPFSICALPAPASGAPAEEKTLVVSTNCGGGSVSIIDGAEEYKPDSGAKVDGVYTLVPGKGCTITITPPDGQLISAVTVGGRSYEVTDREKMTITLTADEVQQLTGGIVEVQFAPKDWIEEHEENDVPITLPDVTVTLPKAASVTAGQTLTLAAETKVGDFLIQKDEEQSGTANARKEPPPYSCTYQWYKGGEALAGQTGSTLTIPNAGDADKGAYTVTVAVTARAFGSTAASTKTSEVCTVTVVPVSAAPAPTPTPAPDKPKDEDAPAATPAPTPAPAAPAAPAPTAAPTPTPAGGKTAGTVLPPATATPAPATPAPALTNTPAPKPTTEPLPPADAQPQATAAPAEATPQKKGVSPLVVGGLVVTGAALAGGLAWLFLPRKKHYK